MITHNDIQPLQAGEAPEQANYWIKIRANRIDNQNLHGVHCGCQADGSHFLNKMTKAQLEQ
jgi:hypothetical protein